MPGLSETLLAQGEIFASGYFEHPERARGFRLAHAQRAYWTRTPMPAYDGGALYPCGERETVRMAMFPSFSYTYLVDWARMDKTNPEAARLLREEDIFVPFEGCRHTVGGAGYVHSIPHYARALREGLDAYAERVSHMPEGDVRDELTEILAGIRVYHARSLETLKNADAKPELIAALEKTPFAPAETLYEAIVGWNFLYYVDLCDNPGLLGRELHPYYRGEDATELLRAFFQNVDANCGWSSALGPDWNPLTVQILRALKGMRRPSMELRVTPDMPEAVWDAAKDALASGCGNPSLYNEPAYQRALQSYFPMIPEADRLRFNGGGCTETMLDGISNVGSLEAGVNVAAIFAEQLRVNLLSCGDYEAFYDMFVRQLRLETLETLERVNGFRARRAQNRPQPIRTLLIDDCIERNLDFQNGGARWNWSVVNFAGLINVVDSLCAVRALVYERRVYGADAFIDALDARDPAFLRACRACPAFGVDDDAADDLARRLVNDACDALRQITPYQGIAFVPASIQFVTYADAGRLVAATPDGRADGAPLADSLAPVHNKDVEGVTAMLASCAKIAGERMVGTPVVNLRLQKRFLESHLRALVDGYFAMGGMQLQINCVSRAELEDAVAHPERHENLIVRVGGYAEYFKYLSRELQQTVIERTEFDA